MRQTKADRKAAWMRQFHDALIARHPKLSGRVDWDAATYYYLHGVDALDAVERYCVARNIT